MPKYRGRFEEKSELALREAYERAKNTGCKEAYEKIRRQFQLAHPECVENGLTKMDHPNIYTIAAAFIIPRINHYIETCERTQRLDAACEEYNEIMRIQDGA